jgi:hypothetical protein
LTRISDLAQQQDGARDCCCGVIQAFLDVVGGFKLRAMSEVDEA